MFLEKERISLFWKLLLIILLRIIVNRTQKEIFNIEKKVRDILKF